MKLYTYLAIAFIVLLTNADLIALKNTISRKSKSLSSIRAKTRDEEKENRELIEKTDEINNPGDDACPVSFSFGFFL